MNADKKSNVKTKVKFDKDLEVRSKVSKDGNIIINPAMLLNEILSKKTNDSGRNAQR